MSFPSTGIQSTQPIRESSEVEIQLSELERAKARLDLVLAQFAGHLQEGGVLTPPLPEEAGKLCAETGPNSPLGERIRGIRSDMHGIASDFERLLGRLAI